MISFLRQRKREIVMNKRKMSKTIMKCLILKKTMMIQIVVMRRRPTKITQKRKFDCLTE